MLRRSLVRFLAVAFGGLALATSPAPADAPVAPGGPNLKTTLEKGLRARRPVEFEFIQQTIDLVDAGTLPQSVVESTFLWARKKRPYPYPFFERALRERAKRLGVTI